MYRSGIMFSVFPQDYEVVELYKDFLPEKIFDAHTHIHEAGSIPGVYSETGYFRRKEGTYDTYKKDMSAFLPGVTEIRINMMPMPDKTMNDRSNGCRDRANQHISAQAVKYPQNAGSIYVMQGDSREDLERMLDADGIKGIKCYWFSTGKTDGDSCAIKEFLPESAWDAANAKKLPIILHMMHKDALSDEENFLYITKMARRYPDAKLVLAHCARSFASWTGVESIPKLADCGNVWFDMAAICEATPMMSCILATASERVMWGSDYPICMHRGRVVSFGKTFRWVEESDFLGKLPMTTVIAESLMAFRQSCMLLNLDKTQIDKIFYKNAMNLFGKE